MFDKDTQIHHLLNIFTKAHRIIKTKLQKSMNFMDFELGLSANTNPRRIPRQGASTWPSTKYSFGGVPWFPLYYLYIYIYKYIYQYTIKYHFCTSHIYSQKTTNAFWSLPKKKCSDPPRCKPGDLVNQEASAGAENPSLGIQAPKLRIVSWNQNTKHFGGDGNHPNHPQSYTDNMTRGLELMKFHWNPDWLMTQSWSRHDVTIFPIKLGSKLKQPGFWWTPTRTVELTPLELCPPFETQTRVLVTAICLLCILRCADQNVWVAHSLAPYDSREFRYPNRAVNLAP